MQLQRHRNESGNELSHWVWNPEEPRQHTDLSVSETEPLHFCSGLFSSWHEAFVSCLKGEGFQSGLSRT